LDDSLGVYFPGFPYPGVTVRTLLNHRSGLPNYLSFMEKLGWDQSTFMHNADILKALMEHKAELENVVPANRHFSYCNTNYALLALIVEKVSGIAYPEFLQSTFFTPLGMKNSFVFNSTDSARAHGSYECSGRRIPDNYQDRVYGDKNIYSTPRDLLLWDRALRSGLLFKEETIKLAYTPYSLEKPGVRNYGLGWRMFLFPDGKKVIYHNGWWHGNNASFIRMIDENATIIVLGSRYSKLVYRSRDLINLFNSSEVPEEEE
jgi:CubicO group peptidase (beta-lactamase class C family)